MENLSNEESLRRAQAEIDDEWGEHRAHADGFGPGKVLGLDLENLPFCESLVEENENELNDSR